MDSGYEENHASRIQFKHFDVVPEAKDHHYISDSFKKRYSNGKGPNCAKIMREWKILEKNLPENIYVQVYETRIDLLRAVIIGAPGTPYHDGLFFFDIFLPASYPEQPPLVYYHSFGYRLNPNLYTNGAVCLSLINTWNGSAKEMWTKKSTILQVLVSIQGLVLNERPFYNEPGTTTMFTTKEYTFGFKSSWLRYNESAFIVSCYTMMQIMKKPPKNFEDFVSEHFRSQAVSILTAILDYQKGNMFVGQMKGSSSGVTVSNTFRTDLMKAYSGFKIFFRNFLSEADKERLEKMEKEGAFEEKTVSRWQRIFQCFLGCLES